jgi:hypothetical protein
MKSKIIERLYEIVEVLIENNQYEASKKLIKIIRDINDNLANKEKFDPFE